MKFIKLRMIWGILRNGSIMFNMEIIDGKVSPKNKKRICIVDSTFTNTDIRELWN